MRTWISYLWQRTRGSLWFLPGLMCLAAVGLALSVNTLGSAVAEVGFLRPYLYRGDPQATRLLLSTLAGSMITVAGVSFSVTMVALSLASSQLGPRLLRNFRRDRGNQLVLGAYISTFLYCILALASEGAGESAVSVAASIAVVMATGSLALLIYFIGHIARSMQADHLIDEVALELHRAFDVAFPPEGGGDERLEDPGDTGDHAELPSERAGYLQSIDLPGLVKTSARHDVGLVVLRRPGHFLVPATPLVRVVGGRLTPELSKRLRRSFILGGQRNADQDPEYGVQQLGEIALRALSPSLNDPFTAVACIDRLSGVLCCIADRDSRSPVQRDRRGVARVEMDRVDFDGVLRAAFQQIRQNATRVPSVSIRLLEALTSLARSTARPDRRHSLAEQGRSVLDGCRGDLQEDDFAALMARYAVLLEALASPTAPYARLDETESSPGRAEPAAP